jgi:hypothetical protein
VYASLISPFFERASFFLPVSISCGMKFAGTVEKSLHLEEVLTVKIMPDFGTVRENEAAFDVAVASITSGDIDYGHSLLAALRDHICSTGEQKSLQWILPKVLETLEALKAGKPLPPL